MQANFKGHCTFHLIMDIIFERNKAHIFVLCKYKKTFCANLEKKNVYKNKNFNMMHKTF